MTPAFTRPPVRRYGTALVVHEGAGRVLWHRLGPGDWRPVRLWPEPGEARALAARIASGRRLLVVLGRDQQRVPLLAEEFAAAPPDIRRLVDRRQLRGGREPYDVHVPLLDWLPVPRRIRGLDLLARAAGLLRSTHGVLLPGLLADRPEPSEPQLRFVLQTRPGGVREARLAAAAEGLFGQAPKPV